MAVSGKAFVISLDCVNAELLDKWTATGRLPNLARLRKQGVARRLTCKSVSIEADWHTFYTGQQPSVHGHCSYDEIIPGTYRSRVTTAPRTVCKPFWETLSEEGARVIAINPVHAAPSPIADGVVITDWLVHDAGHYTKLASYPPEVANELRARYPDDPVNPNDWGHSVNANPQRLLSAKRETLRRKVEVLSELLRSRPWDLCYAGFDECHEMSHLFWHLHDPSHPRRSSVTGMEDPLAPMLMEFDSVVGKLVAGVGKDCTIVVISISGIGPNYHWSHLVDPILRRIDNPVGASGGTYKLLRTLWNRIPHPVQRAFYGLRHNLRETMLESDRRKQRAFALPLNERSGAVRINLAGREPNGIVAESEYDAVCDDLSEVFKSLVCVETGAPLVQSVVKTREVLDGPFLDRLPDLMIEWNVDRHINAVTSPRTGTIARDYTDARTGHHLNDGFVLISGAGAEGKAIEGDVDLTDVAKTVIACVRSAQAPLGAGVLA